MVYDQRYRHQSSLRVKLESALVLPIGVSVFSSVGVNVAVSVMMGLGLGLAFVLASSLVLPTTPCLAVSLSFRLPSGNVS